MMQKPDAASSILEVRVDTPDQPVRLAGPCPVQVRLTNRGEQPVLINRRLALGYRDSQARELFAEIHPRRSREVVSRRTKLYERESASADDYRWLQPGESASTSFDLLEWYALPAPGEYELVVFYQADEPLAPRPSGLLAGVHESAPVPLSVVP
jgi:hypothetical protein